MSCKDEQFVVAAEPVDPDPWTIINVCVSCVSALAMVAQAAIMFRGSSPAPRTRPQNQRQLDILEEGLRETVWALDRLIKLLARVEVRDQPVLSREFSFGESPMLLDLQSFSAFMEVNTKLIGSLMSVNAGALTLLRTDKATADEIGLEILSEFSNLPAEINGFYTGHRSNGEVLDRALLMLRAFERIIGRISSLN